MKNQKADKSNIVGNRKENGSWNSWNARDSYGNSVVTKKTVFKRFDRFPAGCESAEDEERPGPSINVGSGRKKLENWIHDPGKPKADNLRNCRRFESFRGFTQSIWTENLIIFISWQCVKSFLHFFFFFFLRKILNKIIYCISIIDSFLV